MQVGSKAVNFSLISSEKQQFELASQIGKNVVLYFYPKDDTPGCTLEAQEFTMHAQQFAKFNCIVVGVSKDDVNSHCKFIEKYNLGILLLSDELGDVCEKYGVIVDKNMYGKKYKGIERTTFLIDSKGYIVKIWNKVKVEGHVKEIIEELKQLK